MEPVPIFQNEFLAGLLIVALVVLLVGLSALAMRIFSGVARPKYGPDILGREGLAHDFINPKGFVYIDDRVYPARAADKYIKQGEKVIIIAYEGEVLVVRPKTALDD